LGGRLDATRLVEADLCILTTISKEHSEFLGDTLAEIAAEKAAIHRLGVPLIALQHDDSRVRRVIEETAGDDLSWLPRPRTGSTWSNHAAMVEDAAARLGWQTLTGDCFWPGRSAGYGKDWVDGVVTRLSAAHNAESLANDLAEVVSPSVVLLGLSQKANLRATLEPIVAAFRNDDRFIRLILTEPISGRNSSVSVEELSAMLEGMGVIHTLNVERNPEKAFKIGGEMAREYKSELLVIGSVYLIGDLLRYVVDRDGLDLWNELTVH
jgi:folylpolyglutamate synthase/dihydropteroate synthase